MTEYAFILTVQHDGRVYQLDGTLKATPGLTRTAALADVVAVLQKRNGIAPNATIIVMFFSLAPNRLDGA